MFNDVESEEEDYDLRGLDLYAEDSEEEDYDLGGMDYIMELCQPSKYTPPNTSRKRKRQRNEAREDLQELFQRHYAQRVRYVLGQRIREAFVMGRPRIQGLTAPDHWIRENN